MEFKKGLLKHLKSSCIIGSPCGATFFLFKFRNEDLVCRCHTLRVQVAFTLYTKCLHIYTRLLPNNKFLRDLPWP